MKLVLAEDRKGRLLGERSFTSDIVLVGRDPSVCHYFFSQEQWPMVSRKHAEFRFTDGRCVVADANSRFGTFVNGRKIAAPVQISAGSQVQLGTEGPILRVVAIEQTDVKPESKPSELGRMATVRDAAEAAASSSPGSRKAAQPVTPAKAACEVTSF